MLQYYFSLQCDCALIVPRPVLFGVPPDDPLCDSNGVKHLRLNIPRIQYWLSVGAQPSDTVRRLLAQAGILPQPPVRRDNPADVNIMRAMQGFVTPTRAQVSAELHGRSPTRAEAVIDLENDVVKPGEIYAPMTQPFGTPTDEVLADAKVAPPFDSREKRYGYLYSRIPPNKKPATEFPFSIAPTEATMAAWTAARLKYNPVKEALKNSASSSSSSNDSTER